jgi:plasmid replication initiation protein
MKALVPEDQLEFFIGLHTDVPIRHQLDLMERPFFSLAKKPRRTAIEYSVNGVNIRVSPNKDHGIATIWDADILIWLITQITENLDRTGQASPTVYFNPYTLLKAIRRGTSGRSYTRLKEALDRLSSTFIKTNIRDNKVARFHWIEDSGHETMEDGEIRMFATLPRWLYSGIVQRRMVLTVHEDYFLLTGGVERWLYNVVRKHAGRQELGWSMTMKQLYEKSGSEARLSDFAIDIRKIAENNNLPEYHLSLSRNQEGDEVVHMIWRSSLSTSDPNYQLPRNPRRRIGRGITQKSLSFSD